MAEAVFFLRREEPSRTWIVVSEQVNSGFPIRYASEIHSESINITKSDQFVPPKFPSDPIGAEVAYRITGREGKPWIEFHLNLGENWSQWAGFDCVIFVCEFNTLALVHREFFNDPTVVIMTSDIISRKLKTHSWRLDFDGAARELIRELKAIGRQIKAEVDRRKAEQVLLSYDGIGHALRTFVELTGYNGAWKQLRTVENTEIDLAPENRRRIVSARRSLQMFEHAEGLGSLMRLHGWVKAQVYDKILRCYNNKEVGLIHTDMVLEGYEKLVTLLSSMLAVRFEIPFCVDVRGRGEPHFIRCDDEPEFVPLAKIQIPPLSTASDEAAVLLAMSVGLLEPLRNAANHLNRSRPMWIHNHIIPRVEVVLIAGEKDGVDAYIGNPLFGVGSDIAQKAFMHGVELIDTLLCQTRIAKITTPTAQEISFNHLPDFQDLMYLWIRVSIRPSELYDWASFEKRARSRDPRP